MPTFHAFFITHGRTFTPWMNSSFPQCVCVCAYHYYTECAHSIGIRVNRREERLINLSPRRLESGHVRFFFARLLDTSAESQNLPGLELSTLLGRFFPLPPSLHLTKANASSLVLMSTSSARGEAPVISFSCIVDRQMGL